MPNRKVVVLSLVERGWQAARELSLDLQAEEIGVIHIVKGRLNSSVYALIEPKPNVRIMSVHRQLFWPAIGLLAVTCFLQGKLQGFLVDNDRSLRRLRRWARLARVDLTMVRQGAHGYELWVGSQQVAPAAWCAALSGRHAPCPDLR